VKVGKVTAAQVLEIATIKLPDLNCNGDMQAAVSIIKGSARNMGIDVVG
jgi:large subunit ribosomal protein L11